MKLSIAFLVLATAAIAAPSACTPQKRDVDLSERDASPDMSEKRDSHLVNPHARKACYHSSNCSWFHAAKCEQYCRRWGQDVGVDRMEKCNFLNQKRCCCSKM